MKIEEILQNDIFSLSVNGYLQSGYNNYIECVKAVLKKYLSKVKQLKLLDKNEILELKSINSTIIKSLDKYQRGFSGESFNVLGNKLNELIKYFNVFNRQVKTYKSRQSVVVNKDGSYTIDNIKAMGEVYFGESSGGFRRMDKFNSDNLFRIRTSKTKLNKNKDIFHPPFENAEYISQNRYSIPGFPCLYLGNSICVCDLELGIKCKRNVWASRFEKTKNLKILVT
jgi:hypothetical protein